MHVVPNAKQHNLELNQIALPMRDLKSSAHLDLASVVAHTRYERDFSARLTLLTHDANAISHLA
jgi:hypothetical protein